MDPQELSCPACGQTEFCRPPQLVARMQQLGMLRRIAAPEPDMVQELLPAALARFHCRHCDRIGLTARSVPDDEWDDARGCEECGRAIPAERLELFASARRCAACEQQAVGGETADDAPEYCARCGSAMVMQLDTRRGVARYVWNCLQCGR